MARQPGLEPGTYGFVAMAEPRCRMRKSNAGTIRMGKFVARTLRHRSWFQPVSYTVYVNRRQKGIPDLYSRATGLYEEALEIRKKVLGEKHPDYAESLNARRQ